MKNTESEILTEEAINDIQAAPDLIRTVDREKKVTVAERGSLWYPKKQLEDLRLSGRGDKHFLQTHGGRK